jgi:hypothetical protein
MSHGSLTMPTQSRGHGTRRDPEWPKWIPVKQ